LFFTGESIEVIDCQITRPRANGKQPPIQSRSMTITFLTGRAVFCINVIRQSARDHLLDSPRRFNETAGKYRLIRLLWWVLSRDKGVDIIGVTVIFPDANDWRRGRH